MLKNMSVLSVGALSNGIYVNGDIAMTGLEFLNLVIVLLFFLLYSIFFVYQWRRASALLYCTFFHHKLSQDL